MLVLQGVLPLLFPYSMLLPAPNKETQTSSDKKYGIAPVNELQEHKHGFLVNFNCVNLRI